MKTAIRNFAEKTGPVSPLYTMIGRGGLTASIFPLGATIQKIAVLDADGQEIPLALGFPDPEPYEALAREFLSKNPIGAQYSHTLENR